MGPHSKPLHLVGWRSIIPIYFFFRKLFVPVSLHVHHSIQHVIAKIIALKLYRNNFNYIFGIKEEIVCRKCGYYSKATSFFELSKEMNNNNEKTNGKGSMRIRSTTLVVWPLWSEKLIIKHVEEQREPQHSHAYISRRAFASSVCCT